MKNSVLLLFVALLLAACSQKPTPIPPTATRKATETANPGSFWSTRTAMPSRTPTKDTRTDTEKAFDGCAKSGVGVRYVIEANEVSGVSLTFSNDSNGTEQGNFSTPYCKTFTNFKKGDFLYISAQIILPTTGAGSITCKIYDGDKVISQASANGFPNIATCNTSKP
jgi:hypothetical protein